MTFVTRRGCTGLLYVNLFYLIHVVYCTFELLYSPGIACMGRSRTRILFACFSSRATLHHFSNLHAHFKFNMIGIDNSWLDLSYVGG